MPQLVVNMKVNAPLVRDSYRVPLSKANRKL